MVFYKTMWFKLLSGVLIIIAIVVFISVRERNLKNAKKQLEQKVKQRTNEINKQKNEIQLQAEILKRANNDIKKKNADITTQKEKIELSQTGKDNETKDRMDISLCVIDTETLIMQYAGAKNSLYLFRNHNGETPETLKADRMPIGIYLKERPFTQTEIQLYENDIFYIFSDSFVDQAGGKEGRKYLTKNFKYVKEYEYRLKAADGTWRWFMGREKSFGTVEGKTVTVIGVVSDITQRKKTEKKWHRWVYSWQVWHMK